MPNKTPFINLLDSISKLIQKEPNYRDQDGLTFLIMREMDPVFRSLEPEYWDTWASELADFWLDEAKASDINRSIASFQPGGDAYETFGKEYDNAVGKIAIA